jgi:CubicO group peptidase (beta-lactamase class C family)
MNDTGFFVPTDQLDRLPPSYATNPATGEFQAMDAGVDSLWARPPIFESGAGGLVSTADDLLAFSKMLRGFGVHGTARILSRPTVELMTVDHITSEQKARSPFFPLSWENHGWGFGVSPVIRRDDVQTIGAYGWFGGTGTAWGIDPHEDLIGIVLTQSVDFLNGGIQDFWTTTYAAIDD